MLAYLVFRLLQWCQKDPLNIEYALCGMFILAIFEITFELTLAITTLKLTLA